MLIKGTDSRSSPTLTQLQTPSAKATTYLDSNQGPQACEASALPLSYTPIGGMSKLHLEGVYMMSFRPKRGGNGSLASIEIGQFIYMRPGVSAEPSSSVLVAEALPFVSSTSAM